MEIDFKIMSYAVPTFRNPLFYMETLKDVLKYIRLVFFH